VRARVSSAATAAGFYALPVWKKDATSLATQIGLSILKHISTDLLVERFRD
jgi:hypothetical protein